MSEYDTKNEKASGLGLKLCKERIEKLNGIIEIGITPYVGTKVCFSFILFEAEPKKEQ